MNTHSYFTNLRRRAFASSPGWGSFLLTGLAVAGIAAWQFGTDTRLGRHQGQASELRNDLSKAQARLDEMGTRVAVAEAAARAAKADAAAVARNGRSTLREPVATVVAPARSGRTSRSAAGAPTTARTLRPGTLESTGGPPLDRTESLALPPGGLVVIIR